MLKKFLIGTVVALALLVGVTASAAYDFGPSTLKVGSRGQYVMNVQTVVGATPVDGVFGNMTKAKVMAWQASNGLVADGVFGPMSMAKANAGSTGGTTGGTTTPGCPAGAIFNSMTGAPCGTTGGSTVSGGAGDLTVSPSSKDIEDNIKEGTEEKVLALKVEADDSDIQITNVKIEIKNNDATTPIEGSEKLTDYADEVKVYLGSKEVASIDASDFSRESDTPDIFTKSVTLNGAVVKDGDTDYLYVAVVAISDIDSDDDNATLKATVQSVRFVDGTGAIMTDTSMDDDSETFDFKLASEDDQLDIKSSSANPEDATVKVDEDDVTNEVLALAFKFDNDDDSSDMDIMTIQVTADTSLVLTENDAGVTLAEEFIDSVVLKVAGEEFDAEDLEVSDIEETEDIITYTFDIDGDLTFDAGDVEEAKVYVKFNKQDSPVNYADNTTVQFSVDGATGIEAEVDGDSVDSTDIDGTQNGAVLTVNSAAALVSGLEWKVNSTGTLVDFFFKVEADSDDFDVLVSEILEGAPVGNATVSNTTGVPETTQLGVLSKYSGDSVTAIAADAGFTVAEGDSTTFRLRYTLTGTNGQSKEFKITSVAGQDVSDDDETYTATISGL